MLPILHHGPQLHQEVAADSRPPFVSAAPYIGPVTIAPYGSWVSPISVDQLTTSSVGLSAVRVDGRHIYWLEARADEGGRASLWRRLIAGGEPVEITPSPAYVRDRVHEYGGGEYHVSGGTVVYSEYSDGRLYAIRGDGKPGPITPEVPSGSGTFGSIRSADWCSQYARIIPEVASRSTPSSLLILRV